VRITLGPSPVTGVARAAAACVLALLALALCVFPARAAEFATPGGPAPANLAEVAAVLRQDPYDLELLISYGTSRGGSAGHLALAIRDAVPGDDLVYSANFYADRDPAHDPHYYTDALMVRVPKLEYLYGTSSSLGPRASFGLDFGEAYKRSVIGVRVYGVPAAEKAAVAAYFARIDEDYRNRARDTEYHDGEVRYDYLRLNCAKTVGSAFRFGAGYADLDVTAAKILSGRPVVAAANANIPTEMAVKLIKAWHARGYRLDVVLYHKYPASPYVDPREPDGGAFRDLPNRFPSVLSRDFRREQGEYRDYDNLYAMYLLYNLGRYRVRIDEATRRLEIDRGKSPMDYPQAAARADASARADSEGFRLLTAFTRSGTSVEAADNPQLYGRAAGPANPP
jgi:hypothetical protein